MPQQCTVCVHPRVEDINKALVGGEPLRNIAERFGRSATSLHRHKKQHLPVTLMKAQGARELALADSLLVEVKGLAVRAKSILAVAEEGGNLALALKAIRECKSVLELVAKITGELSPSKEEIEHKPMMIFPPGCNPIINVNVKPGDRAWEELDRPKPIEAEVIEAAGEKE